MTGDIEVLSAMNQDINTAENEGAAVAWAKVEFPGIGATGPRQLRRPIRCTGPARSPSSESESDPSN
jgi:hypothetical protein